MHTHHHKFSTLDGLRGFAAIVVMAFHYRDYFFPSSMSAKVVPNGVTAVDLFFVLSGFVLAYAYERRFREGLGLSKFMALRFIRIYPLYILGTAIAIVVDFLTWYWSTSNFLSAGEKLSHYATALLFIPWLCTGCGFYPLNFPAWSLLIEIIGNLFYRLFFSVLTNGVLIGVAIVSFVGVLRTTDMNGDLGPWYLVPALFRIGFSFPVGVVLYRYWSKQKNRTNCHPVVPLVVMAALFWLPTSYYSFMAALLCFPAVIYLGACSEPRGLAAKVYSSLGAMSFGVYMLHFPALDAWKLAVGTNQSAYINPIAGMLLLMSIVGVLALVSDWVYDIPVRKYLNKRIDRFISRTRAI